MKRSKKVAAWLFRRWVVASVVVAVISAAAGLFVFQRSHQGSQLMQQSNTLVRQLPQKSGSHPTAALVDTSAPQPTNKWFSGVVYSKDPVPIYAVPFSYKPTRSGFEVGYTIPTATATAISANHTADIIVRYKDETAGKVAAYDDLSVSIRFDSTNTPTGSIRLTQGSPYIYGQTSKPITITSPHPIAAGTNNSALISNGKKQFVVWAEQLRISGQSITISSGNYRVIVVPSGSDAQTMLGSRSEISTTSVSMATSGDKTNTTYTLKTADGQPTIWGAPATESSTNQNRIGQLLTINGVVQFYKGSQFSTSVDNLPYQDGFSLKNLSDKEKQELIASLKQDISATTFASNDTYGAGKELYRAATLLNLAHQLDQKDQAQIIAGKLSTELGYWLSPLRAGTSTEKRFYYDTTIGGIVGTEPAFGSENFNDHHFHYGYIISAAAELQQYNHSLTTDQQQMVTLMIRDIASPQADDLFPRLRHFDLYAGHAWASGYSSFGDGNNQESTSEALMAWNGVYHWSTVARDKQLSQLAQALLSREANATKRLWLNPPAIDGFSSPLVSLVWGSRLDYTTWFSGEPGAKLGIQLIPMTPTASALLQDQSFVSKQLRAIPDNNTVLSDYIIMLNAVTDKDASLNKLRQLPSSGFDSANSRTAALAYAMTR